MVEQIGEMNAMSEAQDLRSTLIRVLSNTSLGLPLIALVADVIAADARFNAWMAVEGKRVLSDDEMLDTLDVYEDTRIQCFAAIERFKCSADVGGLEAALGQALETLRKYCRR